MSKIGKKVDDVKKHIPGLNKKSKPIFPDCYEVIPDSCYVKKESKGTCLLYIKKDDGKKYIKKTLNVIDVDNMIKALMLVKDE